MKPGTLSQELKEALGMLEGAPPPWLINMQRYGPPPSYPHSKIPGLNAPIPPGDKFGYQPGGWGKPPVDEYGRPPYGDVFGVLQQEQPNYVVDLLRGEKSDRVDVVTLALEELEVMDNVLPAKYEEVREEEKQ